MQRVSEFPRERNREEVNRNAYIEDNDYRQINLDIMYMYTNVSAWGDLSYCYYLFTVLGGRALHSATKTNALAPNHESKVKSVRRLTYGPQFMFSINDLKFVCLNAAYVYV